MTTVAQRLIDGETPDYPTSEPFIVCKTMQSSDAGNWPAIELWFASKAARDEWASFIRRIRTGQAGPPGDDRQPGSAETVAKAAE